jgi:hypothetical protein
VREHLIGTFNDRDSAIKALKNYLARVRGADDGMSELSRIN